MTGFAREFKAQCKSKATPKANYVCFGKIVIELKAVSALEAAHRSQVHNYLHTMHYTLTTDFTLYTLHYKL